MPPVYFSLTLTTGKQVLINKDSISALSDNQCRVFIVGDNVPFTLNPSSYIKLRNILASTAIVC